MDAPARYPEALDFVSAIGKPFGGDEFSPIASTLGVSWEDVNGEDPELQVHEMSLSPWGLQLTFEDEGLVLEKEGHVPGDAPFILTICTFWGYEESMKTYGGPLWEGVAFDDSLEEVEKRIGEAQRNKREGLRLLLGIPGFQIDDPVGGGGKNPGCCLLDETELADHLPSWMVDEKFRPESDLKVQGRNV